MRRVTNGYPGTSRGACLCRLQSILQSHAVYAAETGAGIPSGRNRIPGNPFRELFAGPGGLTMSLNTVAALRLYKWD
jgi:hypothetical protein